MSVIKYEDKQYTIPPHVLNFINNKLSRVLKDFKENKFPSAGDEAIRNNKEVSNWLDKFRYHQQADIIGEALGYCYTILAAIEYICSNAYSFSPNDETFPMTNTITGLIISKDKITQDYPIFIEAIQLIEEIQRLMLHTSKSWVQKLFRTDSRIKYNILRLEVGIYDEDLNSRLKAIKALGRIGNSRAIVPLLNRKWVSMYSDENVAIIKALGKIARKGSSLAGLFNANKCLYILIPWIYPKSFHTISGRC